MASAANPLPISQQPFDAATSDAMGLAFDNAWDKLLLSGSALARPECADATREDLVMQIIELAKGGERNAERLRDRAIAQLRRTKFPSAVAKAEQTTGRALGLMQRSQAMLAGHAERAGKDLDLLAQFRDAVERSRDRLARRG
jgi:hypothetical protein